MVYIRIANNEKSLYDFNKTCNKWSGEWKKLETPMFNECNFVSVKHETIQQQAQRLDNKLKYVLLTKLTAKLYNIKYE